MKITKRQLRRIIREEKARLFTEAPYTASEDVLLQAERELHHAIQDLMGLFTNVNGRVVMELEDFEEVLPALTGVLELIRSAYSPSGS